MESFGQEHTMAPLKDVLLIGFGAVGTVYSLILKKSGKAYVTVVARSNYEAVCANGLHFQSRKYGDIKGWKPDRLFRSISQALDRPYSHVILTAKAVPELLRTPDLLSPLLSAPYTDKFLQPTYVLMQNGLGVERDLYDALRNINGSEEPRIISTAVWIGTRMLNKNTVEHNEFDRVSMGVYRPDSTAVTNTTAETALLTEFADILEAGGSDVIVVPEIQRIKYSKNLWNCVFGATAAISRCALPTVFRSPHMDPGSSNSEPLPSTTTTSVDDGRSPSQLATAEVPSRTFIIKENTIPFIYDALTEMYTLGLKLFPASEAGPGLDPDIVSNTLKNTAALHTRTDSTHRPSMLVDVEMGRPMELDVVVGEVVRMGRKMEVPMPRIETLYALSLIVQDQLLRGR